MGLFNKRREIVELRNANATLLANYKKSRDELAEVRALYENAERIIESNSDTYKRLQKRIAAQQKIIDAYREKYGEIRPNKIKEAKPIGFHKEERKIDHDPFIEEKTTKKYR